MTEAWRIAAAVEVIHQLPHLCLSIAQSIRFYVLGTPAEDHTDNVQNRHNRAKRLRMTVCQYCLLQFCVHLDSKNPGPYGLWQTTVCTHFQISPFVWLLHACTQEQPFCFACMHTRTTLLFCMHENRGSWWCLVFTCTAKLADVFCIHAGELCL